MLPSPRPLLTVIDLDLDVPVIEEPVADMPVSYPQGIAISLREDAIVPVLPAAQSVRATTARKSSPWRTVSRWAWTAAAILGFTVGGWNLWHSATALHATTATVKSAPLQRELLTKSIETLRPGMRVLADNPELRGTAEPDAPIDPATWRLLRLHMTKADGSGLDIELLRPLEWLLAAGLDAWDEERDTLSTCAVEAGGDGLLRALLVGRTIDLDLPELGASGPAQVNALEACPKIERANWPGRRLVTGTFRHEAAVVHDLMLSDGSPSLGVTGTHPFWSEDRHEFVPAASLRVGEHLRRAAKQVVTVTSRTPRAVPQAVYNLEVDVEHVYHVGSSGILVHNAGCFGSAGFGQKVHKNFAGYLSSITSTPIKVDRTAPGLRGLDITFMKTVRGLRDSSGNLAAGFKHAELKPATQAAIDAFIGQLRNWRGQGMRGNVGLFA